MGNPKHLEILKQGVEVWNKWRSENRETYPDLRGADLSGADLRGADLSDVDLSRAFLSRADLSRVFLSFTNLISAILISANLRGADLSDADLSFANFSWAHLQDADFTDAILIGTVFADTDLSEVKGLESVIHDGPSGISISALYKSAGQIPESFLRGCGLNDWEIESAKLYKRDLSPGQATDIAYRLIELRTNPAIQFNSCFISYSSLDQKFSEKLYADLQKKGVRCWFALEDMRIGDRIRDKIDEAIRLQNRLLLVLSACSIESQWVEQEVETALEKERREKRTILCPIKLDEAVMNTNAGWAAFIRKTRHIGDFSGWGKDDSYQKAFDRLLRDLKAEAVRE
jgi:hypothetical protein